MTSAPQPLDAHGERGWLPGVSVIMSVLDEEDHLADAVQCILDQDYTGSLEVVIALGPSRDRTDRVATELMGRDERVRTVPNPSGRTPAGLNAALAAARFDIIVRVDGHALVPVDYVRVAVDTLARTGADNVGGVMAAEGVTPFERAVARAMTSVIGVGAASFHVGGEEGPARTVYLGAFRRGALDRVGGYDEEFERAQDWEMNHRIRDTGGLVWFTPRMTVSYRPRSSVQRLARQYYGYGRWRREIMREHPETVSLRYLAAPIAVAGVTIGTVAALAGRAGLAGQAGEPWLRLGVVAPVGYTALILAASLVTGRGLPPASLVRLPLVYATMHGSWGVGFLASPRDLRA
ncbi:MAG TPA: glycosyltransferase family 2 protein [Candidatus Nanopelagicales bacterium]|jgi:glycosyltransferase involved in cell wall biosynthesis